MTKCSVTFEWASVEPFKMDSKAFKKRILPIMTWICENPSEVHVRFCDGPEMKDLNCRFRSKNKVTDVLSFPVFRGPETDHVSRVALGDIAICIEVCSKQAQSRGLSLESELERMICHGLVHLKGFDHERSDAAHRVMSALERSLLKELKLLPAESPWLHSKRRVL
jgi:probable rRNA maturation factor